MSLLPKRVNPSTSTRTSPPTSTLTSPTGVTAWITASSSGGLTCRRSSVMSPNSEIGKARPRGRQLPVRLMSPKTLTIHRPPRDRVGALESCASTGFLLLSTSTDRIQGSEEDLVLIEVGPGGDLVDRIGDGHVDLRAG